MKGKDPLQWDQEVADDLNDWCDINAVTWPHNVQAMHLLWCRKRGWKARIMEIIEDRHKEVSAALHGTKTAAHSCQLSTAGRTAPHTSPHAITNNILDT